MRRSKSSTSLEAASSRSKRPPDMSPVAASNAAITCSNGCEVAYSTCSTVNCSPMAGPLDPLRLQQFFGFLAGHDAHDLDGSADHVGGALLASRAAQHLACSTRTHR